MNYNDDITKIKGIGEKTKSTFLKLNIKTIQDLIEHYPRGYDEFEDPVPISQIREGVVLTIEGSISGSPRMKRIRNLQIINCEIKDRSGKINLTWFNMPFLMKTLKLGYSYIFRGKVARKNGALLIEQPKIYTKAEYYNLIKVLQPVYPLTSGLTNNGISKFMGLALRDLEYVKDHIPRKIVKEYNLLNRTKAIKEIHFPKDKETMFKARKRLAFDEFFIYILALRQLKDGKQAQKNNFHIKKKKDCDQFIENLPYKLTKAQLKVWEEVKEDLTKEYVMNRLVQGDVGSGKTIIAILALLMVAKNGYQGTLMVPTEVLARQHFESLESDLKALGINTCLLVGSMTQKEKRIAYEKIRDHEVHIIVGTHALIQEKVEYSKLGLVITDEQHRFGVKQRESLYSKGESPHIMVMSATPIPRTLAIILYGDLDISAIDELPAKRLPIKNCVVNTNYRQTAYTFIKDEVAKGRQAYIICPMVEESETIEAENVIDYTETIKATLPPSVNTQYLHGKMKASEKNDIMDKFTCGEIDVLVSTTVVEVGVNVPNATVMMVENSERFGLAQLHQLRGRVGRGEHQSYCIFICGSESKVAKERLGILNKSNDGFYIASEDLKLRGPGDMFGIIQSGEMVFKIGDIFNDASVLKEAGDAAKSLSKKEVDKMFADNPELVEKTLNVAGTL